MRIERLRLKKLNNTRDLGGFPAEGGKHIKHNLLIRSGKLYNLPQETVDKIKAIGVTDIIDLRTDREQFEYPSTEIEGINRYDIPLMCTATTGITHQKSMAKTLKAESKRIKDEFGTADNYMISVYNIILTDPDTQKRIRQIFDIFLNSEGGVLWHCSAGKDRTGVIAMLLEAVLGVDEKLIIADYMASNGFQRKKRTAQKLGLFIAPTSYKFKQILYAMMEAKKEYICGSIDYLKREYGSVTGYVKAALKLTGEEIQKLKDKYLE